MGDRARIMVFAVALGVVCSSLLAGVTLFTAPYREANEKAEEQRSFLAVLGAPVEGSDARTLVELFDRDVRKRTLGGLEIYEYVPAEAGATRPVAVAVPFAGMGLWGEIRGVVALDPDLRTIRGISFYKQDETPGLGGEIGSEWFRRQFVDKRLVSDAGVPGFRVLRPGEHAGPNEVDGISGATLTGDRVQRILTDLSQAIDRQRGAYVE